MAHGKPTGVRGGRHRSAAGILGALALAAASAPGGAAAEESVQGARLRVQIADGIAGCPSEAELAARVRAAAWRPAPLATEAPPPLADGEATSPARAAELDAIELGVSIFDDEAGLVGRVVVTGGRVGRRELRAATCTGLADALVVLIGMVLDEEARAARAELELTVASQDAAAAAATPIDESGPTTDAPLVSVPAEPGPPPGARATAPPEPTRPTAVGAARTMTARAVAAAGVSTELTEALLGGLELGWAPFSLRALVAWRLPHDVDLDPGRISSRWVGGVLAGCGTLGQRWRATGCVQGWGGSLHAEAAGFTSHTAYDRLWTALGASAGLETGQRVTLGAEAIGLVPLNRDRFQVINVGSWDAGRPVAWLVARAGLAFR